MTVRNVCKLNVTFAVIMVMFTGEVFATVDESTVDTQSVILTFSPTQMVQHKLTVVADSFNSDAELLAEGQVSTVDGKHSILKVRYNPDFSGQQVLSDRGIIPGTVAELFGLSQSTHSVTVLLENTGSADSDGWLFGSVGPVFLYRILRDDDHNTPIDKYVVSMQAGIWTE